LKPLSRPGIETTIRSSDVDVVPINRAGSALRQEARLDETAISF
jgi:hypothetical protein